MDENKNNVNSENTQTEDMNYSFDFANQVENEAPKDITPVQTEVTGEDTVSSPTTDVQTPLNTNDQTPHSEDVQTTEVPSSEVQDPAGENDQNVEAMQVSQTEVSASQETKEMPAEETKEEDSIELIKDKKETKKFLIILFVIILLFIIALPFIFSVAG